MIGEVTSGLETVERIGGYGDAAGVPSVTVVVESDQDRSKRLMVAAVVLAAGAARRFGAPKQRLLLPLVLERVRASGVDEIVVVAGAHALEPTSASSTASTGSAARAHRFAAGLDALAPETEAAVVVLADGPRLAPEAIDRVIAAWRETGAEILAASYGGDRATPCCSRVPRGAACRTRAPVPSSPRSSPATTSGLQETSIRPMNGRRTTASRRNETPAWSSQPHSTTNARRSRKRGCSDSCRSAKPRRRPG